MSRLRPSLPVFAIGAGALHAIALAILLPLLITLPGRGGNSPPKPVNIEVDIGPSAAPAPVVPDLSASHPSADETSALPQPSEPKADTADTLAAVSPEAPGGEPEAAPREAKPVVKPVDRQKPKPKVQVKAGKAAPKVVKQTPQRKTLFARGRPSKPLFGGSSVRSRSQGPSWGALFNAPPSAADASR